VNCLKGYVGLRGCGVDTPVSLLYVNSLPGISLKTIDKTATDEQKTFFQVWEDVENRAIAKFKTDIAAKLAAKYRLKSINQSINLGRLVNKSIVHSAENQLKGFSIDLRLSPNYKQSTLQAINLQTVSVYATSVKTGLVLKVMDVETGDTLETKTFDVVEGWNLVQVNSRYEAQRIFVGVDSDSFDTVHLTINQGLCQQINAGLGIIYGESGNAYIRGAKTTDPTDMTTLSYGSDCYGVSAVFSIVCRYDNLICNNLETFATAFWYLLGAELMIQGLASDRINLVTLNRESLLEKQQYFESEYNKEIDNVLKGLNIDTSDPCIECNAPVRTAEARM